MKKSIWKNNAVQSLLASLICILLGLLIGYIVLLCINPAGASGAIMAVIKNFMNYSRASLQLKNFGATLVKTAPLLMCALSVLFAYKAGLFNIGAAGQYTVGICASLYAALAWHWSWIACMLFAILVGALWGTIPGLLKAYCNVNVVISGIMLNWIRRPQVPTPSTSPPRTPPRSFPPWDWRSCSPETTRSRWRSRFPSFWP